MNLFEKQSRLNQFFAQNPVNAAYLAGALSSRTSFGHISDVDIAILLMDQIKADQFLEYRLYFFSELAKQLESDSIDVMILNQASQLLKLQVIKHGQILYSRDEKQRVSFESKIIMDYLDFKKFDEIQRQAFTRRLQNQTLLMNQELIQHQLQHLSKAIEILREVAKEKRESFIADYRIYGLAERYLQQAIEACLQICSLLVAAFGLRRPEGYHELLSVIAGQHLMPRPLAYRLEILVNLREALIYDVESLDHELLYEHIQHRLTDLAEFSTLFSQKQA
jgi:uncharacterized protein YutE (UPF0331/DUF86 family)/predicted nucleotidyltransferase